MLDKEDVWSDKHASLLLAYTLHESQHRWLGSLMTNIVPSLEHFCDLIEDTFYHFDPEYLDQKLLQQWKASHESLMDFWQCFRDLKF